ncbi:MAG: T9SS type A sorting domain-containing protein [Rhodothermaceae bacterium]|nr:T9SS type A sorting domain-containing protein [Rhodothermaceae bacterium]MYD20063.1 T9SS type A sorting domain-containing protein [Rhodothermaceae bacterium]MYD56570.1 T9SS type A sorting domain-containing protein [Rhodothermaceae bacterium]MYI43501.1 T9SS type A sorting domain-containing protein [Rhodothermaceae bacterium]MYJ56056.1 T9SS type A sorting domain-containing protein [Rhodothermaceae bacterium]
MKWGSLVVILVLSCHSPLTLFAQDLSVRPAAPEVREKREEGPDIRLSPRVQIPDMPWGTEGSDVRLGWSATNTERQSNSGDGIAMVKVTVKDNDKVDTANEKRTELPEELLVQDNYPNPFRNATRIVFHLPEQAQVNAEVFDILGRVVYTSQVHQMNAGWDRTLSVDLPSTSSGMYIYRVSVATTSGTLVRTGRMIKIR